MQIRVLALLCLVLVTVVPARAASTTSGQAVPLTSAEEPLPASPSGMYIVALTDPPLASYAGGIAGLPATSPRVTGMRQLNTDSMASRAYRAYLACKRRSVLQAAARIMGSQPDVVHVYDAAYNGMALRLTPEQARQLVGMAGVQQVIPDSAQQPQTDVGPGFIGAAQVGAAHAPALFKATLNAQPPTTNGATGSGVFTYDAASRTLQFQIGYRGLSGPATVARLYRGAPGTTGTAIALLNITAPGAIVGQTTLLEADEAQLYASGLYITIDTAARPTGEIRGQIVPNQGEGMIVGVIDTGINFGHASFAATGADGYTAVNPLGASVYRGACDPNNTPSVAEGNPSGYNPAITCNNKLIGAWTFAGVNGVGSPVGEPSPADDDGHGSHTASTAAGNIVSSTIAFPNGVITDTGTIGGVAPHANIIAYDVCDVAGCFNSAILAAIDQAVKDKVNVLNFSIGGSSRDPWSSLAPDAIGFLNALDAGIMTAVSAGNEGPGAKTILAPSNAPWVMSVAASTHNRVYRNTLTDFSGVDVLPPTMTGKGFSSGTNGALPIVYAGYAPYNNPWCQPFANGVDLSGLIVVCERGGNGRVEKAENVARAGGAGFVLVNDPANGNSLTGDAYSIPGVHLTYADGARLKTWLANVGEHRARITGAVKDLAAANGDIVASFSSRGPDTTVQNVMKPDLAAPGVDILAAVANTDTSRDEFEFQSGTSMAAPHVAGAMTLLRELHPDWTPSEIYSALMTTAITDTLRNDDGTPAGPFDRGAGRIDVRRAALAGLVLPETAQNYARSNPATGGDSRALNRASLMNMECVVMCSWTRTVRNTLPVTATWEATAAMTPSLDLSVTPSHFVVAPGAVATLTVTATLASLPLGARLFGAVTLREAHGYAPAMSMPVVAQPAASNVPELFRISSDEAQGSATIRGVKTVAITDLAVTVYGMTKATLSSGAAPQDPTNGAPFDSMDGVVTSAVDVPPGTARFVTEVITTTSQDLDLYVALDGSNGSPPDGIAQSSEIVCISATATALERCNLPKPQAGHYIVLVQNWQASQRGIDAFTLASGVVPAQNNGTMTVTGPSAQPAGQPFDIKIGWNVPRTSADRWYGAVELGSDPSHADNLGYTAIDLVSTKTPQVTYMPVVGR